MHLKQFLIRSTLLLTVLNCTGSIEYSEDFKNNTSGKYLYNTDELIEVGYENDKLFLIWKNGKIRPVALSQNEFFVADMYSKFRFVQHPETKERYLSVIPESNTDSISYDYLKVSDDYKTPSMYLRDGNWEAALVGYQEIKKKDSTSSYINEWDFNAKGYSHLRDKNYDQAIGVFKLNVALHPNSSNVYDSLADAYRISGDSIQAYVNYKKALELNPSNRRAKKFIENYTPDAEN